MRISNKRSNELYNAVHNLILQKRLENCKSDVSTLSNDAIKKEFDDVLFGLVDEVYQGVCTALNLQIKED